MPHVYYLQGDYGDVSDRKELRKKLQCHSFDWFVKNIYPELFVPGEAIASGEVSLSIIYINVEEVNYRISVIPVVRNNFFLTHLPLL